MKSALLILALLLPLQAWSYIPRINMIMDRTSENAGKGSYQIEQEVSFSAGLGEPMVLKETWIVENEDSMKLIVTGARELKDSLKWYFIYSRGQRLQITNQGKQSKKYDENFSERWFHFRRGENLAKALINLQVLTDEDYRRRAIKQNNEYVYPPQKSVRLARTGGSTAWAFGVATTSEANSPGVWIEQDQFVIRKVRTSNTTELTAENFGSYARGLNFPRKKMVRWDSNQVQMHLLSINASPAKFSPTQLEVSTKMELPDSLPEKNLIEEFYKRFR